MEPDKIINPLFIQIIFLNFGKLIHKDIKGSMMNDWFSAKIDKLGIILKGEWNNKDKSRTCYVRVYNNHQKTPKVFLRTTHPKNIRSITVIHYNNQYFILVSGCSNLLNIFLYDPRNSSQFIGKIVLCNVNFYQTQSNHSH